MSLVFRPGLTREGVFYELPQPITQFQVQDHWDFDRYNVLLEDGDFTRGLSRQGVDIVVRGNVAQRDGLLLLSEAEMWEALAEMRQLLAGQAEERFDFSVFRGEQGESSRYFRECLVVRFQYELSQPELYSYALTLHADDPVLYELV